MKTNLLMIVSAFALTACGGGGGSGGSSPLASTATAPGPSSGTPLTTLTAPVRPVAHSDAEIAQLLFTDSERTPGGFYTEETPPAVAHVSTVHLKNSDVAATVAPASACSAARMSTVQPLISAPRKVRVACSSSGRWSRASSVSWSSTCGNPPRTTTLAMPYWRAAMRVPAPPSLTISSWPH